MLFKAEKWEEQAMLEFFRDERKIKLRFLSEASRAL